MGSLVVLGIALAGAGGVFGYEKYLESVRGAKIAELQRAREAINTDTVEGFVRLRNRLSSAGTLVGEHVAVTQFLDVLETVTLQTVRFDTLTYLVHDERTAEVELTGAARTFNALAAQSSAFAAQDDIRRAIFSEITVTQSGAVTFSVVATIDPDLVIMRPSAFADAPAAPAVPEEPVTEEAPTGAADAPEQEVPEPSAVEPPPSL